MDIGNMEHAIGNFLRNSPLNIVEKLDDLRIFDTPLLGIASAEDILFEELKRETAVGSQHMAPRQWLSGSQSVLSYFLPFTKVVREANRCMGLPAQEWLYGRIEGELCNRALSQFIAQLFIEAGYAAVVPAQDERFKVLDRRSNWSERHVAYIAGLGTLSLSCSLITQRGSAGRLGSVIVSAPLTATQRHYTMKDEYCTKCGRCIMRCPPLAIDESGKSHTVCAEYLERVLTRFHPRYGCGKCQTDVPCEDKIPGK